MRKVEGDNTFGQRMEPLLPGRVQRDGVWVVQGRVQGQVQKGLKRKNGNSKESNRRRGYRTNWEPEEVPPPLAVEEEVPPLPPMAMPESTVLCCCCCGTSAPFFS